MLHQLLRFPNFFKISYQAKSQANTKDVDPSLKLWMGALSCDWRT